MHIVVCAASQYASGYLECDSISRAILAARRWQKEGVWSHVWVEVDGKAYAVQGHRLLGDDKPAIPVVNARAGISPIAVCVIGHNPKVRSGFACSSLVDAFECLKKLERNPHWSRAWIEIEGKELILSAPFTGGQPDKTKASLSN